MGVGFRLIYLARKVNLVGADVAAANSPCAAFVATTSQVAAFLAVRVDLEMLQPEPVTVYVTAPDPEPPEVAKVIRVPAGLVVVALEIVSVAWAPKKVKVTAADVAGSYVASAAFVAVTEHVAADDAVS